MSDSRLQNLNIPSRIATDLLAALTCVRVVTLAGHPGFTKVTIGTVADRTAKGERAWLFSSKIAEKVIAELFSDRRTRRSGSDLVIELNPGEAINLVRDHARLLGFYPGTDGDFDADMARITKRVETAIDTMRRAGTLRHLNRVYAALPADKPTYSIWFVDRIRGEIPRFADFTGMLLAAA